MLIAHVQGQVPQQQQKSTPECIAEFCLNQLMSETDFVRRYGKPPGAVETYCYRVAPQRIYVHFGLSHETPRRVDLVFVSDVPNCLPSFSKTLTPKTQFHEFVTAEGVRIGDPQEKVIERYGPPTDVGKATGYYLKGLSYQEAMNATPFGNKVLTYTAGEGRLLYAEFYIRTGKVAAILISVSE